MDENIGVALREPLAPTAMRHRLVIGGGTDIFDPQDFAVSEHVDTRLSAKSVENVLGSDGARIVIEIGNQDGELLTGRGRRVPGLYSAPKRFEPLPTQIGRNCRH